MRSLRLLVFSCFAAICMALSFGAFAEGVALDTQCQNVSGVTDLSVDAVDVAVSAEVSTSTSLASDTSNLRRDLPSLNALAANEAPINTETSVIANVLERYDKVSS